MHVSEMYKAFHDAVRQAVGAHAVADVIELGGGRLPHFKLDDLPENMGTYTLNDINQGELDLVPDGYSAACFDVCGPVDGFAGRYNVVVSRWFAEHVPDGRVMHENALALLRDGGTAVHLAPKLYTIPFVVNWLLPERLGQNILNVFVPSRAGGYNKFPAYYSWCRGSTLELSRKIKEVGYSDVSVIPIYGHSYYKRIPIVRELEAAYTRLCMRMEWTFNAPYMLIVAHK